MKLIILILALACSVMATPYIRYVNPDNTGIQNGLTEATGYVRLGSGLDSLDNTSYSDSLIIICSGSAVDATADYIIRSSNWGGLGTNKMIIRSSTGYTIESNANVYIIRCYDMTNVEFENITFRHLGTGSNTDRCFSLTHASNTKFINCVFDAPETGNCMQIDGDAGLAATFRNCVFTYKHATKTSSEALVTTTNVIYTLNIDNCVVSGFDFGIRNQSGAALTAVIRNTVFLNNTDDIYSGAGTFNITNCATEQGAGEGTSGVNLSGISESNLFLDASNWNFHLSTNGDNVLKGAGTNLYSTFTTDIDGDARQSTGNWDVGIDVAGEAVASICTLFITHSGSGSTTPTGSQTDTCGDSLRLVAIPDAGNTFIEWSGRAVRGDDTLNDTVWVSFGNDTVTSVFEPIQICTLFVSDSGNGSTNISGNQTDTCGDSLRIIATPDNGYNFLGWSGASNATNDTAWVTIANDSVYAVFGVAVVLEYVADVGGSITGNAVQILDIGADGSQVTASASSGYEFLGWSKDDQRTAARTDLDIVANTIVVAHFGAIDTLSSGTATYGNGGRYNCLIHAIKNIHSVSGNIKLIAVSDDTIFTRQDITGDFNGYELEIDGGGYKHYGTGIRQHIYIVHTTEFPRSVIHDVNLYSSSDMGYAQMGAFPGACAHTADWYNILMYITTSGGSGGPGHPFYLNGGYSTDGASGNASTPPAGENQEGLIFNFRNSMIIYPDVRAGASEKKVFETEYNTQGLHLNVENVLIYSQGWLANFRPLNQQLASGHVQNVAIFGSYGNDFILPEPATYNNIMTSDASGTAGLTNATASQQFQSLDPNNINFGVPIENSLADTAGVEPTLSLTDYNGDAWEEPYPIGPIQLLDAISASVTTQPANDTVTSGGTARFIVAVSGSTPITYKWCRVPADSVGTNDTLQINNVLFVMNGYQYYCIVNNEFGSDTSDTIRLTVLPTSIDSISPRYSWADSSFRWYIRNLPDSSMSFVKINNVKLTPVTQWSGGQIIATVPHGTPAGLYRRPWIGIVSEGDTIPIDTAQSVRILQFGGSQ